MLRRTLSTFVAIALFSFAPVVSAGAIEVGEVSGANALPAEDLATLRKVLATEVGKLEVPKGTTIVVSANVVKLETTQEKNSATTTCAVSLAVRDGKTGALRGLTSGTSVVTTKPGDKSARSQGIEGAVQGATRGLPKLMKP